jgi:hypothetical protein
LGAHYLHSVPIVVNTNSVLRITIERKPDLMFMAKK